MQIFYCEGCGLRISNDDVSADAVIKHEDKMYCLKCAAAKGIKPPTKGSNTRLDAIKKAQATSDKGLRAPAAAATPAAAHSAVAVRAQKKRSEESGKNAMTIGIVIGVAGLLLFLVNLFVFAGRPKNTELASAADKPVDPKPVAQPSPSPTITTTNPVKNETPKAPAGHFLETPKIESAKQPAPNIPVQATTKPEPAAPKPEPRNKPETTTVGKWDNLPVDFQNARVLSLAFSPDAKWLLCGCADNSLRLIDLESRKATKLDGHAERISSVAFSPNGKMFASACWDKTAKLWDLESKTCKLTLKGHTNWVWGVAFSADNSTLMTASFDKSVRFWNTETGADRTFNPHVSEVLTIDSSPTGTLLLTAGTGLQVHVWDYSNDTDKCKFSVKGVVHSAAFSPDMKRIGLGFEAEKAVGVYDISGKQQCLMQGHTDFVHCVCFVDNNTIASCGKDKLIKIWDINGSKELVTLTSHTAAVNAVAYCPQRKLLVSGSSDGKLRFWQNNEFFDSLGK